MLCLGQQPAGGIPVALQHLQLQEEGALHVSLHQPPERLLGLQSPEQPHRLQAREAASRQRRALGEVQRPIVPSLVVGTGLEELVPLVPQGRPQRDLLPRAEAGHSDAQRLVEEAAGGRREADDRARGGEAAGRGHPGGSCRSVALWGCRPGAGQLLMPGMGACPAQNASSDPPHEPRLLPLTGGGFRCRDRPNPGLGPGTPAALPG